MQRPWASLLAILMALPAIAAGTSATLRGTLALQGQSAKAEGYLTAAEIGNDPLNRRLDTWMTPLASAAAIRTYDVDMTKLLHMIIVSDDFRTFFTSTRSSGRMGTFC